MNSRIQSCYLVLLFFTALVGLGELVAELVTELAFELALSPFLSICSDPLVLEHFARISLKLLVAVLASAQVGVSLNVGNLIIRPGEGEEGGWELVVDIM